MTASASPFGSCPNSWIVPAARALDRSPPASPTTTGGVLTRCGSPGGGAPAEALLAVVGRRQGPSARRREREDALARRNRRGAVLTPSLTLTWPDGEPAPADTENPTVTG